MPTTHRPDERKEMPAIVSTAYLPGLDYMSAASVYSSLLVEHHETYPKQTWRNRCRLLTANGVLELVIPVTKPGGRYSKTGEVLISNHLSWQKQHWRTIASAYASAPFFLYYEDLIRPYYFRPAPLLLTEWNEKLLTEISGELGFDLEIRHSASFLKPEGQLRDLRYSFSPKSHKNTPAVAFQWPAYTQVFSPPSGFVPNLSVVDLLFNTGPDAGAYLQACGRELFPQFRAG